MSLRAREFVDFYIEEFLHPDTYEDEETFDDPAAKPNILISHGRTGGATNRGRRDALPRGLPGRRGSSSRGRRTPERRRGVSSGGPGLIR